MIVLDTHVWVWWICAPENLSPTVQEEIDRQLALHSVIVSTFSTWEVAMLIAKDRLQLSVDLTEWVRQCERIPGFVFQPITNAIALAAVNLPGQFHPDPADRLIVATARVLGATLVTGDQKIRDYRYVRTLW
ncbi:MAG: type II toxin-antitoxin system VapC family toxin [Methylohalobius sp.]|nr:type II toxin-antitoxin system VapC family toxin [Methylohalobius sp.]